MSLDVPSNKTENQRLASRRSFIKSGGMFLAGGAIVGGNAKVAQSAHAYGSDTIKLGLVGCGRRGIKTALEVLNTGSLASHQSSQQSSHQSNRRSLEAGQVELVAMADVFKNNLHSAYRTINGQHGRSVKCNLARFHGMEAYQSVMQSEADVVILATPPFFRPKHFQAAIEAGKHVFMERPVAVNMAGIHDILAAGNQAAQKCLAVQVGLQRRHEQRYRETINQLQSGIIGDVVLARTYSNVNRSSLKPKRENETIQEYQIKNWQAFGWLGGDLMVEQHIQNLDVINWLMDACPVEARGYGGNVHGAPFETHEPSPNGPSPNGPSLNEPSLNGPSLNGPSLDGPLLNGPSPHELSLDYQCAEFTYADGTKLLSQCRRSNGCWNQVGEHVQCTRGSANISEGKIFDESGDLIWKSHSPPTKGNGWQAQQFDLVDALRSGERPNETELAAKSTMTAILGQIATRRNGLVRWDDAVV